MAKEVVERIFCKSIDVKSKGQIRFGSEKFKGTMGVRNVAIATSVSINLMSKLLIHLKLSGCS